jgi:hypothetical protein
VHLRLAGYKEGRVQLKKAGLCLFINQKEQKKHVPSATTKEVFRQVGCQKKRSPCKRKQGHVRLKQKISSKESEMVAYNSARGPHSHIIIQKDYSYTLAQKQIYRDMSGFFLLLNWYFPVSRQQPPFPNKTQEKY